MELNFFQAYAITFSIETLIIFILLRKHYSVAQIVRNSFLANTITLPIVWFIFPLLFRGYLLQIGLAELFAFLLEAAIYSEFFSKLKLSDAMTISIICNVSSFFIGLLIMGWDYVIFPSLIF